MDYIQALSDLFNVSLKGESKTYDDHNWYSSSGLNGYILGQSSYRYPLLQKPLSSYTVGEIKAFQARPRDNNGQLWAVGRYQVIPATMIYITKKLGIDDDQYFSKSLQDKIGEALILDRSNLRNYIRGYVPDTADSLNAAALDMAKIWSSIGVPYPMQGAKKYILKNQSYYSGGGDVATVKTEDVQRYLKILRNIGYRPIIAFGGAGVALLFIMFFF